ncbi:hypothetical protein ABPG72_015533 [Tetrahymena utriculariae]
MIGGNYVLPISSKEEGVVGDITNSILNKFQELKQEKINFKEYSHFYGLDDSVIELDQLKMEDDDKIKYKNKQDLKVVTFLISGYTTQGNKTSENFGKLVNSKNMESQTNLFVFFKWSDSSLQQILKTFLKNVLNNQQTKIKKEYLENLLNNWLQEWNCSKILKKIVFWLINVLKLCIKFATITTFFFGKIINLFLLALDSIIEDFQAAYQQAKNGGTAQAKYINYQNLMGKLNIDFMGHSLGTVVTAYALKDLAKPARYIILMGGAATVTEIEDSYQNFQMCYNFYSTQDNVIKTFLEKAKLIGDEAFIGTKPFDLLQHFFNLNTEIDHLDYMNKYYVFYDIAMKAFEDLSKKKFQENELVKKSNRFSSFISTSTPDMSNYKKLGQTVLGIAGGSLLLYLFLKHSKRVYN